MTTEDYTAKKDVLFTEDNLKKLACYSMEFAKKRIAENSLATSAVATHDKVFKRYLAYIVFGRIVKRAAEALNAGVLHASSVRLFEQLGLSINQKLAKSGRIELQGIDFSDHQMIDTMRQSFDTVNVDDLRALLAEPDIATIRTLGPVMVPDNPKAEQKISTFPLE